MHLELQKKLNCIILVRDKRKGLNKKQAIRKIKFNSQVVLVIKNPPANSEDARGPGSILQ